MAVFHVRIDGSVVGFVGVAVAFALLTSSFGLLIAAIGKTPEATRGLAIFATLVHGDARRRLGAVVRLPAVAADGSLSRADALGRRRARRDDLARPRHRRALAPVGVLLAFSALFAAVAIWRFDWEEPR